MVWVKLQEPGAQPKNLVLLGIVGFIFVVLRI